MESFTWEDTTYKVKQWKNDIENYVWATDLA